jgi:hypothetical protein
VIDTGGATVCAEARAGSGTDDLSLAPMPPSRRIFEFTLGSDNRSSWAPAHGTLPEAP